MYHSCYLCFLGHQESLDVHQFQEYQENPFVLGYQEFLSAHRHLQQAINVCVGLN